MASKDEDLPRDSEIEVQVADRRSCSLFNPFISKVAICALSSFILCSLNSTQVTGKDKSRALKILHIQHIHLPLTPLRKPLIQSLLKLIVNEGNDSYLLWWW